MLSRWVDGVGTYYHDAVWRALTDSEAFAAFRRDRAYSDVLGFGEGFAREYFAQIDDATILTLVAGSEAADRIGGPLTFDFGGRRLSPNTLRYAKVLQDFTRLFPGYAGFASIAEIGVGYGGQARMVSEHARAGATALRSYTLVDMLPACLLAQSYLDNFRMRPRCEYLTTSQLPRDGRWDFVVSNYAFSEFDAELQRDYLDLVVSRARSGYLTMNSGLSGSGQWKQPVLPVETLLAELPNAALLSEKPVVFPANYILVFGEHAAGRGVPLEEMRARERREIEAYERAMEISAARDTAERRAGEVQAAEAEAKRVAEAASEAEQAAEAALASKQAAEAASDDPALAAASQPAARRSPWFGRRR